MSLPYEGSVSGDRALAEAQKILSKFGCQSFGTMIDTENEKVIVAFKWRDRQVHLEASWRGYAQAWLKKHPARGYGDRVRKHQQKALAVGRVAVCSVLRDWIKGQTTAVECGVMSFEASFFAHMLLPNGQRVIDRVQAENLLPPPKDVA